MMGRIDDGFPTTIEFSAVGSVVLTMLFEKEVTPPGVAGGGANPTTTMRNTAWRTASPKQLKTLTPAALVVAYDPDVYDDIVGMVNVNQSIVITFADDTTMTFWGWLDEFNPNPIVEGEQPTANVVIIPSNQDASGDEVAPAMG